MSGRGRLFILAGLFLAAVVALELPDATTTTPTATRPRSTTPTPDPTVTPPPLSAAQINRQDRVSRAQRRRETTAFDSRPLLAVLPIELADVSIDITGLAADHRTTILTIAPGPHGRRYAQALYRRTLHAYGDPGTAYTVRWAP